MMSALFATFLAVNAHAAAPADALRLCVSPEPVCAGQKTGKSCYAEAAKELWSNQLTGARSTDPSLLIPLGADATSYAKAHLKRDYSSAVGLKDCLWRNGQTIRVSFLDGTPRMREKVEYYAREWERYANLRFEFVRSGAADIRITFDTGDGSWSWIGTCDKPTDPQKATMNYGWLDDHSDPLSDQAVVLHEFGHALGLGHEQSNPAVNISWNKEKVYEYYGKKGWDRQMVDFNVFHRYGPSEPHTVYDSRSIMQYPISAEHTTDGFSVPWNTRLTDTDKAFIARLYPGRRFASIQMRTPTRLAAADGWSFTVAPNSDVFAVRRSTEGRAEIQVLTASSLYQETLHFASDLALQGGNWTFDVAANRDLVAEEAGRAETRVLTAESGYRKAETRSARKGKRPSSAAGEPGAELPEGTVRSGIGRGGELVAVKKSSAAVEILVYRP